MAAITASMVKELREATGAGMMECKKALTETDGNFDAAVEVLKKSGAAKMEKKASRIAAEGICRVAVDGNKAVVVEVNSETDFVAKNEVFQEFVQDIANTALASGKNGGKDGEDVQALLDGGLTEVFAEKTLKIGEKLSFRRFEKVTGDAVASYIHGGGKIGVLVAGMGACDDAAKEALTNIAMQIAAMNPQYISRNEISQEELDKKADRNNELLFKELETDSKNPYIYFQLGQSFMLKRDERSASEWFEKGLALDLDPSLEYVQIMVNDYGQCLLNIGEAEKACFLIDYYDTFCDCPEYVFLVGTIYLNTNRPIQAYKEYLKCLSMKNERTVGTTSFFALHNIGLINEMLGDSNSAITFYEKAAALGYERSISRLKELKEK